ncbi:hypothetical protein KAU39_00250 [bacterium]|nr:hypothetical protein [bacterium]
MNGKRELIYLLICGFLMLGITACTPTFPREKVSESIIKICKENYDLDVEVKITGETLSVGIVLDNLIEENFYFTKEAKNKIDRIFLTVTRVCLSTDAPLDFFVIICRDTVSEVDVSFVRYIDDIKKSFFRYISQEDYFNRLVLEIVPQDFWEKDDFSFSEIKFPGFLSAQMVQRLNAQINQQNLSVPKFYINAISKKEEDDELVVFECKLEAEESKSSSDYMWDEFLELLMETVYNVCGKYKFFDYEGLRLLEADGEEIINIKKTALENMQKGKKDWVFK